MSARDNPVARLARLLCGAALLLCLCVPARAEEADALWNHTLEAARKEGVVVVSGPPGSLQRGSITGEWGRAFPDIKLTYSGGRGSVVISKIVRERSAGLYNWDVILASTNSVVSSLVPVKVGQRPGQSTCRDPASLRRPSPADSVQLSGRYCVPK